MVSRRLLLLLSYCHSVAAVDLLPLHHCYRVTALDAQ